MPVFLQPIHEFNPCHVPAGSPEGGQFCPVAPFLNDEAKRAYKLRVPFSAQAGMAVGDSGYDRLGGVEIGLSKSKDAPFSTPPPDRADILTVARHELGHVTDSDYGYHGPKAQRVIDGQKYGPTYANEFGAWRAAIRDSPHGRVRWSTVRRSLLSYITLDSNFKQRVLNLQGRYGLLPSLGWNELERQRRIAELTRREAGRIVDRHLSILQRYAKQDRRHKDRRKP